MLTEIWEILVRSWSVLAEMAPYLLFGFLVAGLLSVFISPAWLERHLGGKGMGPVWKAALFGVPLPLCSCGVIPVSASLRRHGASRAATTAFLLSTPQTGVDSILVTQAILGPVFAIYRPLMALVTGIFGGGLVRVAGPEEQSGPPSDLREGAACGGDCLPQATGGGKIRQVFEYGFLTLPGDIGRALLLGVVLAGLLSALVPPDALSAYLGGGFLSILLMMAVGVPIYVCATASVPIAAAFIHMGATPGAALAFLIAGPATNAATITTLWRVLGSRTTLLYLGTVAASALGGGLLLDRVLPAAASRVPELNGHVHGFVSTGWLGSLLALALLIVVIQAVWRPWRRRAEQAVGQKPVPADEGASPSAGRQVELSVQGMHCSHCVASVRRAVSEVAGVTSTEVNLETGQVIVTGQDIDAAILTQTIEGLGFEVRSAAVSAAG